MGRIGLRTVLQWCVFFCAALATASIPAAVAQTHAPKTVSPTPNAALNSAKDSAPVKTSPPDEPPAHPPDTPAEQISPEESPAPISDLPSNRAPANESPANASDSRDDFMPADGLPLGGARGVTHPLCLRCPPAQYSYPALLHGVQGNVTLDAIVGADGWVSNVKILGSLGSGLDEQAVKAVRTWQWEPARDAAGKIAAAHQTVVITFRIPK
jgi:TonB family protein